MVKKGVFIVSAVCSVGGQAIHEALQITPTTLVDCRHSNYRILSNLIRALL